jgi:fructokinase
MLPRVVATIAQMAGPVLVVGELLADVVADDGALRDRGAGFRPSAAGPLGLVARAGGSSANVAVGLARLGVRTEFAGRISTEGIGPWLRAHLVANGVGTSSCVPARELPTLAFVGLDPSGVPSYAFYGPDTADWQWSVDELPDLPSADFAAVHTGSLATALPPGAAALAAWLEPVRAESQVLVSYDPNVRPTLIDDAVLFGIEVEGWVARSHLVKVSEEDLAVLHPHRRPLAVATEWASRGPELVVVTHGAGGATALRRGGEPVLRPGRPVDVVDTVGAGDAFSAGLLAWLADADALRPGGPGGLSEQDVGAALDRAIEVSAVTCSRAGADPPTAAELTAST